MVNTYTQIHIHIVFVVKNRQSLIEKNWKNELYAYISGIIANQGHKLLAINGTEDHVHILIGMRPVQSLSGLVQDIKGDSSKWINQKKFLSSRFSWQESYAAFSYSKSHVHRIMAYIRNQEEHHRKNSFGKEYRNLLKKFGIDYDERFIFKSL